MLPVDVQADDVGRYSSEIEAAVYFCCLEAMQNAGKHAGPDASIVVAVTADDDQLSFTVTDDGAGFEPGVGIDGHGFVNMRDRLGALGGELTVFSEPGCTRITGRMPITVAPTA